MYSLGLNDFISGWIGGICGLIIGHPLDTVKVRQQTFGANAISAINKTYKYEGFRGFYKGMLFPILTVGPSNSLFFGTYATFLRLLDDNEATTKYDITPSNYKAIYNVGFAGLIAGIIQATATCPMEVVKTLLQANTEAKDVWKLQYEIPCRTMTGCIETIYKMHGFPGFFRGLIPMLIRDAPTSAIYTLTYEMLLYFSFSDCTSPLFFKQMIAGGAAGITSWILVIPFDVVKSRMQVDNPKNPKYKGMTDCFRQIVKQEGWSALNKGFTVLIIRGFLSNSAIFFGYETSSILIYKYGIM